MVPGILQVGAELDAHLPGRVPVVIALSFAEFLRGQYEPHLETIDHGRTSDLLEGDWVWLF